MSTGLKNPSFDYAKLAKDEVGKLRYFEGELGRSRKRVADELVKHGEILHGAQQLLAKHATGVFVDWLDSVGVSSSSAYRAIAVYQQFGGFSQLGKIEVSAMYELTKNESAKQKAMKLVEKGVTVTRAMALELIAEEQPEEPPPPAEDEPEEADDSTDDDSTPEESDDAEDVDPDIAEDLEEFPEDETLEEICTRETSEIESWARKIAKLMKEAQEGMADYPTLDELNARTGWERKMSEALATLRSTKPRVCPICQGNGDNKCPCKGHGRVTRQQYNQMV